MVSQKKKWSLLLSHLFSDKLWRRLDVFSFVVIWIVINISKHFQFSQRAQCVIVKYGNRLFFSDDST